MRFESCITGGPGLSTRHILLGETDPKDTTVLVQRATVTMTLETTVGLVERFRRERGLVLGDAESYRLSRMISKMNGMIVGRVKRDGGCGY